MSFLGVYNSTGEIQLSFQEFIIPQKGFRYPPRGVIIPLEGFSYPSKGFIIPLEGIQISFLGVYNSTGGI